MLVWARGLQGKIRPIKLASRLKVGNVRSVEAARQPRLNQEKSSWFLRESHQPAIKVVGVVSTPTWGREHRPSLPNLKAIGAATPIPSPFKGEAVARGLVPR